MTDETRAELSFLKKLGNYKAEHKMTKAEVLRGYINAAAKRDNWDGIDKREAVALAVELLSNEIDNNSRVAA